MAGAPTLDTLRGYLADLQTLSADFSQEVLTDDGELVESASGHVSLKKPGRFRWDYTEPFERLIVADGERVWLYEADLEQVTVRSLGASLGETPAALLSGATDALDRFELVDAKEEAGIDWLTLRPVSMESDFELIRLGFESGVLTGLELGDRLGQTTRIRLSDVVVNAPVSDSKFRFDPPPGVDVINESEL